MRNSPQFPIKNHSHIIGVDEVGMGSLAGPVVVCAVLFSTKLHETYRIGDLGIRDSKLMTAKQRETSALQIRNLPINYQISLCYPATIDKLNIYQASRRAMRRAILTLSPPSPSYSKRGTEGAIVLVDGPHIIPGLDLPQQAIIKGDQKIFAIACASILAKVYRDKMMQTYAKRYPQYGFQRHKGYGTAFHYAMLAHYGPSLIHRRSFSLT